MEAVTCGPKNYQTFSRTPSPPASPEDASNNSPRAPSPQSSSISSEAVNHCLIPRHEPPEEQTAMSAHSSDCSGPARANGPTADAVVVPAGQEDDARSAGRSLFCGRRFPHVPSRASSVLAFVLSAAFGWGTLVSVLGQLALPGGHVFALFLLFLSAYVAGHVVSLVSLPPLLGMLIMGFVLRNVPYIDFAKDLNLQWSTDLRSTALAIILLRAGLGLDPDTLRRLSIVCFRLAFTPCLVESACIAVASHFLLGFPWLWGFLLGFVIGAVSPAVVVPSMLSLQEKGLGMDKGIPVLIIAAASIDDVLAITGFGIVLGIVFSQGNLAWTIAKGPLEAVAGVAYGSLIGVMLWLIPSPKAENVASFRTLLLLFAGLFALFASREVGMSGAGPLGCLCLAFIAGINWRKSNNDATDAVRNVLANLWTVFQPLLFGLIGTEIVLERLDGKTIGLGIAVLAIGIVFRMSVSSLVVWGAGFTWLERAFVALAWLPKATVQAAIGPVALDYARQFGASKSTEGLAIQVLTIAVLSILVTAPLGAVAIALSGPRLLTKQIMEKDIGTPTAESTTTKL